MDYNKCDTILNKINTLIETCRAEQNLSDLERDLLLDYIKSLYATVRSSEVDMTLASDERMDEGGSSPAQEIIEEEEQTEDVEEITEHVSDEVIEETDSEILNLFDEADLDDKSDSALTTSVKDLTKCMGINEKIFTVKELFGGDQPTMEETMADLNTLNSYEEAREYLVNKVATKYDWVSDSKRKKSLHLIRLIRRRYD